MNPDQSSSMDAAEQLVALFGGDEHCISPVPRPAAPGEKSEVKYDGRVPRTVHKPPTVAAWRKHLAGQHLLGFVPHLRDGSCRVGALDIDDYHVNHAALVQKIKLAKLPLIAHSTKSGGARALLFLQSPKPAREVREVMTDMARMLGLSLDTTEIFPQKLGECLFAPYFGPQPSDRACIRPGSKIAAHMLIDEFVVLANEMRVSDEAWEKLRALVAKHRGSAGGSGFEDRAERALARWCAELASTKQHRNDKLYRVAKDAGRLAGAGWVDRDAARQMVMDAAIRCGLTEDEIRGTLDHAFEEGEKLPPPNLDGGARREELVSVLLSEVQPREVRWFWPNRFALGKLSLIAGHPGMAKSTIGVYLAAQTTRGNPWPNNEGRAPQGSVVILSAEDDTADTLRPRFDAAGGDPARVTVIEAVKDETGNRRGFDLTRDLARLEQVIDGMQDVRLVIIDPISAYLGGRMDSHRNTDVRAALAPLQELAARREAAVIAITHLPKSGSGAASVRAIGSVAFSAAARAVFLATEAGDEEDPDHRTGRRLFLPAKNNLGPDRGTGLAYTVQPKDGSTVVTWEVGAVAMTADEALSSGGETRGGRDQGVRDAMSFLRATLRDGPKLQPHVVAEAKRRGFGEKTLRNASERLRIAKKPGTPHWTWALSETQAELDLDATGDGGLA